MDTSQESIRDGTEFFLKLYKKSLSFTAVNKISNMLSTNLSLKEGVEFGKHLIVILRLKRIFKGRQAIPRYVSIYYADIVIEFLKSLPTWDEISTA